MTPNQKQYSFPRTLRRTEQHEKIIDDYRARHDLQPLPSMSEEEIINDQDQVCSINNFGGAKGNA